MYKIMLADDEGIVIDSLKFIIEKEFKDTCEVQYAKTGRSVIELAESFRPDVAVVREVVRVHDGTIKVYTNEHGGTTFEVCGLAEYRDNE